MYLQIAQSTGLAAGVGGEGLAGMVLGLPRALSLQAHADLPADGQAAPTPHQRKIQEWRQAPPQQRPHALPTAVTILTPDLLTSPKTVEVYRKILTEVGVEVLFWVQGPGVFAISTVFFYLPPCFAVVLTAGQ